MKLITKGPKGAVPKRPTGEAEGRAALYPYYAGFSYRWAHEKIRSFGLPDGSLILDPYNGAGTTTAASVACGHHALGFDMNPVTTRAALARLVSPNVGLALMSADVSISSELIPTPLGCAWLSSRPAADLGSIALTLREVARTMDTESVSHALALVDVVLFRALRRLTEPFVGSNPTWVRRPKDHRQRLRPSTDRVAEVVREELQQVGRVIQDEHIGHVGRAVVAVADASAIPVIDNSVDLVITSPPYCTRIDYAVATSRELAILGVTANGENSLRRRLTGTTLNTRHRQTDAQAVRSAASENLLASIRRHAAADSAGYYYRQFSQYLSDISRAIASVARVTKAGGHCVYVVQDSFYQEVPVRLAKIIEEEFAHNGVELNAVDSTSVTRNLITLNTRARSRRASASVCESVLTFRKVK